MSAVWSSKNRMATSLVSALPAVARLFQRRTMTRWGFCPSTSYFTSLVSPHCASAKIDAAGALVAPRWAHGATGLLKLIQPFEVTQTLR